MPLILDEKDKKYILRLKRCHFGLVFGGILMIIGILLLADSKYIIARMTPHFVPENTKVLKQIKQIQALKVKTVLEDRLSESLVRELEFKRELSGQFINFIFFTIVGLFSLFIFTFGLIFFSIGSQMRQQFQFIKKYFKI